MNKIHIYLFGGQTVLRLVKYFTNSHIRLFFNFFFFLARAELQNKLLILGRGGAVKTAYLKSILKRKEKKLQWCDSKTNTTVKEKHFCLR